MVVRKKRSISVPADLDILIEEAAKGAGLSYSGWLAEAARKEFTIRAGLAGVAEYERQHGRFTDEELADARQWVDDALSRGRRSGTRSRRSA